MKTESQTELCNITHTRVSYIMSINTVIHINNTIFLDLEGINAKINMGLIDECNTYTNYEVGQQN